MIIAVGIGAVSAAHHPWRELVAAMAITATAQKPVIAAFVSIIIIRPVPSAVMIQMIHALTSQLAPKMQSAMTVILVRQISAVIMFALIRM
jgi:hypothetical protein